MAREKIFALFATKRPAACPEGTSRNAALGFPRPGTAIFRPLTLCTAAHFASVHAGTGFRNPTLPSRQFDKISGMLMTNIKSDFDNEDVRPTDIMMALGGFWVMLGVIAYLAVA
jgi:hypothetical protein